MEEDISSFAALEYIVARLRAPDGCPWDRKQTHESLKPFLIEEAYEALQALDETSSDKLCEELGDLLLQIEMRDVIKGIAAKLIRRHPHVFGDSNAADAEEVELEWETLKQEEREPGDSLLSSVPKGMPALSYSHSIQRRAAGVGFDWENLEGVLDKLVEEVRELGEAHTQQDKIREFGDLLFSLVNVARWHKVDLEEALRLSNERFCQRFRLMEENCRKQGVPFHTLPLKEQDALWEEAKRKLNA
jgi:tetrapyrrole methylase family protein/MazG family protein